MSNLHPIMQQALAPFVGAAFHTGDSRMEIETRVAGIPCIARVTHYFRQAPHRGGAHTCDSDLDYYGYTECEFDILDRRGRPAPWLERKATDEDRQRIEQEITEQLED